MKSEIEARLLDINVQTFITKLKKHGAKFVGYRSGIVMTSILHEQTVGLGLGQTARKLLLLSKRLTI